MISISISKLHTISQIPDHKEKILAAAMYYIGLGIHVIPIKPNEKSLPPKSSGVTYASASTNAKRIQRWFGTLGEYRGWNIGIACGKKDGVFVVDIDTKDRYGNNGFDSLRKLESEHGILSAPCAVTPRGGRHYFYQWEANCTSTTSKLAKAIDTRGGDEKSCKSHVVVFPSIVDGKEYEWSLGGNITPPPSWIPEFMDDMWIPKDMGRGSEEMEQSDCEGVYSAAQLNRVLSYIDPDDLEYDEWLNIGMAIQTQQEGEAGLVLWDSWSKRGQRYKTGECQIRWDDFADHGTVRVGTLIKHAQREGFNPIEINVVEMPNVDDGDDPFSEMMNDYNERFAVVVHSGNVSVLVENKHADAMTSNNYMPLHHFRAAVGNEFLEVFNSQGVPKPKLKADIWFAHPNRREYKGGEKFCPNEPSRCGKGDDILNLWRGWEYEPISGGSWDMFKGFIKEVIANGDEEQFNWIIDWMADVIQEPTKPKGCAIILTGEEGTGKGTFANIFGELFGRHFKTVQDEEHLVGRFNSHLKDTLVLFADEVTYGGSKKVAGKLKALVTESMLMSERKGIDTTMERNYCHLIVASNEKWVIPAGTNSRRWYVTSVSSSHANDAGYFKKLRAQMDDGGYEAMMHDLKNRKIESPLHEAPKTAALIEQRELSSSSDSVIAWWVMCIDKEIINAPAARIFGEDETDNMDWGSLYLKTALYDAYSEWCSDRKLRLQNQVMFNIHMKKIGLRETKASIDGKRMKSWIMPTAEKCHELYRKSIGATEIDQKGNDDEKS